MGVDRREFLTSLLGLGALAALPDTLDPTPRRRYWFLWAPKPLEVPKSGLFYLPYTSPFGPPPFGPGTMIPGLYAIPSDIAARLREQDLKSDAGLPKGLGHVVRPLVVARG